MSETGKPWDTETERQCLGGCLVKPERIPAVDSACRATSFCLLLHQNLAGVLFDLSRKTTPVADFTIVPAMEGLGYDAEFVIGFLDDLRESASSDPELCAKDIEEAARRRDLREAPRPSADAALAALQVSATAPKDSEENLALEFARQHKDDLRYVHELRKWMWWSGRRWTEDKTGIVAGFCREICRNAALSARGSNSDPRIPRRLASAATVEAVERLARADCRLVATAKQWDEDPWLLNTPDGTINLKTGEMRAHREDDYLTKMTAVSPAGDCPLWKRVLDRCMAGDIELQRYMARFLGYSLTGLTTEQLMSFWFGTGANGKTVLLETVSKILGDYAQVAPMELFTASNWDRHPTELALLQGARLVRASETEVGRVLAEAKIKLLTGGDEIPARKMRQDFFTFIPQFKVIMAGNHKPTIKTVDEAMKRRVSLIPFLVTIPREERDPNLFTKLKAEWPGILKWKIDGCLEWQSIGLSPPKVVTDATADYLDDEDTLNAWTAECCRTEPDCREKSSELYASFKRFAEAAGEDAGSNKAFSARLETHGFKKKRSNVGVIFNGIALIPNMTGGRF
jgi:putative DNA primase/helicase